MKKKFFAELATGLFVLGMGSTASALQIFPTPDEYTDIGPSTTYQFDFDGLYSPVPLQGGALIIKETNADFNNEFDTLAVNIDGVSFGGFTFAEDNGNIERTLQVVVPLDYADLFYIANNSEAVVSLTTSSSVGSGNASSLDNSLTAWLDYSALDVMGPGVPELPVSNTTSIVCLSPDVHTDIGASTTYNYALDCPDQPVPFQGGALFVKETNADFNNDFDTVAVNIDGLGFGGHYFADDNGNIERGLMLTVPLDFTELFYILHDGEVDVALTTSDTVGAGLPSSLKNEMTVWMGYQSVPVPEPASMLLFGAGLAGLVGVRKRKQKKQ